jgi:hypothetical protein
VLLIDILSRLTVSTLQFHYYKIKVLRVFHYSLLQNASIVIFSLPKEKAMLIKNINHFLYSGLANLAVLLVSLNRFLSGSKSIATPTMTREIRTASHFTD